MKIKKFIKNQLNKSKKIKKVDEDDLEDEQEESITMRKGSMIMNRFDDARDPLVAERFTTQELRTFLTLYSTYPWAYVCANAIATAAASVPFQLLKKGEEIKNPDDVSPYLNKPNPNMTWHELMETTLLHLELAGNSYWEVVNDGDPANGKILAIFPLRPDRIRIIPDPKTKIREYEYTVNGNNVIHFQPNEIIHLKYTDARSEYYGVPPIAAVKNEITLDFNATSWNKSFFKNGAEPGGVLETDKSLTEQAYQRLRQNWYKRHKGVDKAHEVAILEEGLKYHQITSKHADMQYYDLKAWSRDTVLSAMRVPGVIVGIQQKLSVGTERDQKKTFWHNNIIPKLSKIQHIINAYLMPEGITFSFVIKAIDSIIEDDQIKTTIVQSNIAHGVMTINEARKKYYGMDPVEWGDTWWRPVGLVDVENPIAVLPSPTGSPSGQGVTTGNGAGLAGPSKVPNVKVPAKGKQKSILDTFVDIEKIDIPEPDWDNAMSVKEFQEFTIFKSQAGQDEKRLRKIMVEFFDEQASRILRELENDWPLQKDDRPTEDILMDSDKENKLLKASIVGIIFSLFKKYGSFLMGELAPKKKFDTTKDYIREWLEKHAGELVTQINSTTKELIKNQLLRAYDNQESMQQVYERLAQVLTGEPSMWRVFKIARTELMTLTNNARHEAAKQSGVAKEKRWVSMLLPTTRERANGENHVAMHNVVVKMDEKFKAPRRGGGYDLMDGPGDTSAHPENRVNCLCYLSYYSGTEEFKDINVTPAVSKSYDIEQLKKDLGFPEPKAENPPVNVHVHMSEGMVKQDIKLPDPPKVEINNKIEVPKQDAPIVKIDNVTNVEPTPVNIEVKASDVKAPDVKVENKIDVQPSPVHVEKNEQIINVNVPKQETPIVNVDIKPSDVNVQVNPELKVPNVVETTEILRDDRNNPGRITGSRKEIKPKSKE